MASGIYTNKTYLDILSEQPGAKKQIIWKVNIHNTHVCVYEPGAVTDVLLKT